MSPEWQAVWLTLKLAGITTALLLVIGTPIAWWLARTGHWLRQPVSAVVALPLVLPPTVLGFYLLIVMGPDGALGRLMESLGLGLLPFTFEGLVLASVIYSLPFTVQPLQTAFLTINQSLLETAATLRASPRDRFFSVVIPLARPGFLTAAVLTFAHTVGEFGVVLMVGGNIPGETRVVAIAVFEHVETLDYSAAHALSLTLLVFSFMVLLLVYWANRRFPVHAGG